tara:strand:- start:766 stop:1083 length:318 start_codon:yes stop_codon:yes gene_type:complete
MKLTPMDMLIWEKWNEIKIEYQAERHVDILDVIVDIYSLESTKDQRYQFKKQLLKLLGKYEEHSHEELASSKGGQYEVMFNEGLIPHYDPKMKMKSPLTEVKGGK